MRENNCWQPIRPSAFTQLIGPILMHSAEPATFAFRVQEKHDNTRDRPHGGMIMSFMDEALGLAAHSFWPGEQFLTVSFECQFIDGSRIGDLVVARVEHLRSTRSLMFLRGTCLVDDRVIASCSGVWKRSASSAKLSR